MGADDTYPFTSLVTTTQTSYPRFREFARKVLPVAPWAFATMVLAFVATRDVLDATGGEPAVPLDDAYIHFQYARAFAGGHPFVYTPGASPTPGATSLLWPLLLSPFTYSWLGDTAVVWWAWLLAWAALAALAYETSRLAGGLCTPLSCTAAGVMVLAFGGYAWFAASGMEVLPFAWLLATTARRSSEWVEAEPSSRRRSKLVELAALAWLCPLMRPEGIVGSVIAGIALLTGPHRARRSRCLVAFAGMFAPALVYWAATGSFVSTTAAAKWLILNPYYRGSALFSAIDYNVRLLFTTLLDGQLWTSAFLPSGCRIVAWLSLPALAWAATETRRFGRSAFVALVALAMSLPTTYETFLVNRVRYIWPFAFAWFIGASAIGDLAGAAFARIKPRLGDLRLLVNGAIIGFLASRMGDSLADLAASAEAITRQQVSLGKWIAQSLPPGSLIGVNDAGAIAYFGHRRTFDVVGLTTRGEARYWVAGPASRFEHYERLAAEARPTHFVVYPEWFAIDVLLGPRLTERTVMATILGGPTMVAHEARYDALGSGARPLLAHPAGRQLDELDVADLESEAAHGYDLLHAAQRENVVVQRDGAADGARSERAVDRFSLAASPSGTIVARFGAQQGTRVALSVDATQVAEVEIATGSWSEAEIRVPGTLRRGRHSFEIRALGNGRFTSMHYWSYE